MRRPGKYDRAFAEKRLREMAPEEEKVVALTHLQPRDEASAKEEVVLGVSEEELQAVQRSLDQMPGVDVKAQDVVRAIGNYLKCMDVAIEADLARREGGASSSDALERPPHLPRIARVRVWPQEPCPSTLSRPRRRDVIPASVTRCRRSSASWIR